MQKAVVAVVLAVALAATVAAQEAQSGRAPSPEESQVAEMANALGMLRGVQLRDAILTFEYQGTGSQFAVGQSYRPDGPWPAFTLTNYKASVAHDAPGMRVELERTNPDGSVQGGGGLPLAAAQKQILVVSGKYAWNETEAGAGLVPGKGTATAAAAAWADRSLEYWMLPHSFVKAARMANSNTRVGSEAGVTVVTANVPEMPGVVMKAWVNGKQLIDRVESRLDNPVLGDTIVEVRYSEYRDINGEENPSDVLFPGRIVRSIGGHPVLDLMVTRGNTYNPYVIIPVPDSVSQAAAQTAAPTAQTQEVARGTWYVTGGSHHSVALEFRDYMAVIEAPQSEARAQAVIDAVKKLAPNKPIRYVINSHHHFDHSSGLRTFVAEGATVLTHAANKPYYDKVWANPRTLARDRLARTARRPNVESVSARRVLSDGSRTLELHWLTGSNHSDTMLIAYLPQDRLLVEADVYTPVPAGAPVTPTRESENLYREIQRLRLDVERILPLHGRAVPFAEFRAAAGRDSTN